MKNKTLATILIVLVLVLFFIACGYFLRSITYLESYTPPNNPFDDVYEVTIYHAEHGIAGVVTTRTKPELHGNVLKISNYWEQQFDEEGNEEWVKKQFDEYYILIPLFQDVFVEINHIEDIDNTATVIELWTWEEYSNSLIEDYNK